MWTLDDPAYRLDTDSFYPHARVQVTFFLVDDSQPPNHDTYVETHQVAFDFSDTSTAALAALATNYLVQRNKVESMLKAPIDSKSFQSTVATAVAAALAQ